MVCNDVARLGVHRLALLLIGGYTAQASKLGESVVTYSTSAVVASGVQIVSVKQSVEAVGVQDGDRAGAQSQIPAGTVAVRDHLEDPLR